MGGGLCARPLYRYTIYFKMFRNISKIILTEIFFLIKEIIEPLFKKPSDNTRFQEFKFRANGFKENIKIGLSYIYYTFIFEKRLRNITIVPSDFIKNKFLEFHYTVYPVLIYLIDNHSRIKSMFEKLKEFLTLSGGDVKFESDLNEIVGVWFLETQLKYKVLEIEIISQPVFSPHCKNKKSCDILANDGFQNLYFESKMSMSQDLRPRSKLGEFESYTPISNIEIREWIRDMLYEANQKGANYLLIRVPFWTPMRIRSDEEKIKLWISRTFDKNEQISENVFRIKLDRLILNVTKGFYIIFPHNFIKVEVCQN